MEPAEARSTASDSLESRSWPLTHDGVARRTLLGTSIGRSKVGGVLRVPQLLSLEECDEVHRLASQMPTSVGTVRPVSAGVRRTRVASILPAAEVRFLFERVGSLFLESAEYFGFWVSAIDEPLQYLTYDLGDGFEWHSDLATVGDAVRKISITVQLSDAEQYAGGGLEFAGKGELPCARNIGTAIVFPSFVSHRVATLTAGRRHALVAWATGPAFC